MEIELNEQEQRLLEHLMVIPPDLNGARILLTERTFSPEAVTKIAIDYAWACMWEVSDLKEEKGALIPEGIIPGLHSTHLVQVFALLLRYGMDPNGAVEDSCLLHDLQYVDNEYLGADALALLLENGADPNKPFSGSTVFEEVDFDVLFGSVEQRHRSRFESTARCWMVLLGYGGMYRKPDVPYWLYREFESDETFDLKKLRDHRNYYVGLSIENGERMIHIYDRRTFWEVARF